MPTDRVWQPELCVSTKFGWKKSAQEKSPKAQDLRGLQICRCQTEDQIARAIGVSQPTITHWRRNPGLMTKEHERRLVLLFEKHGVPYNPMLSMEEVKMA